MTNSVEIFYEQGSDEWLQNRRGKFNASELAAAIGIHPNIKRNELLHAHATGIEKEYSDFIEKFIFAKGHRIEPIVRAMVEKQTDEDFVPKCFEIGNYACSLDGQNIFGNINLEIKQFSKELFEQVGAGVLPDHHKPQVQQGLWLTNAEYCIFAVCNEDQTDYVSIIVHPDIDFFEQIPAIWAQFEKDRDDYQVVIHPDKPQSEPVESLPMPSIRIDGGLSVISNLDLFGAKLREFCAALTTNPQDDQDFANLEDAVKRLKSAEDALENAENASLATIKDVSDMRRAVADLKAIARTSRLTSEKLVKTQKEVIKLKILADVKEKFATHIAGLQSEIKVVRFEFSAPDFAGAMKNKRSIASLHDAVDTELAAAKILADKLAKEYRSKLAWYQSNANANGFGFLFMDIQDLIKKPQEDFELTVTIRIATHKKNEEIRLNEEREKIRIEEAAKAQKEYEEKVRKEAEEKMLEQRLIVSDPVVIEAYFEESSVENLEKPAPLQAELEKYIPPEKQGWGEVIAPEYPGDSSVLAIISDAFGVSVALASEWVIHLATSIEESRI